MPPRIVVVVVALGLVAMASALFMPQRQELAATGERAAQPGAAVRTDR